MYVNVHVHVYKLHVDVYLHVRVDKPSPLFPTFHSSYLLLYNLPLIEVLNMFKSEVFI